MRGRRNYSFGVSIWWTSYSPLKQLKWLAIHAWYLFTPAKEVQGMLLPSHRKAVPGTSFLVLRTRACCNSCNILSLVRLRGFVGIDLRYQFRPGLYLKLCKLLQAHTSFGMVAWWVFSLIGYSIAVHAVTTINLLNLFLQPLSVLFCPIHPMVKSWSQTELSWTLPRTAAILDSSVWAWLSERARPMQPGQTPSLSALVSKVCASAF